MKFAKIILVILASLVLLNGCVTFNERSHHSSSLVQYLYPKGMDHPDAPAIPTLSLPLRVGVAWVPERNAATAAPHVAWWNDTLNERQKMDVLNKVTPHFKSYPFVRSIEVIPSAYLSPGGGFANLDQLRTMFDVDIIALVSYDQVQFSGEGFWSLAYLTVVGAWVVEGEKNDTQTMIDTAVYDVRSRKLLFRAPGTSRIRASSAPINVPWDLRKNSEDGFQRAASNMVTNLQEQLAQFQERVKEAPEEFKIVHKPGYVGGGASGMVEALMAAALALLVFLRRKVTSV